MLTLLQSSFEVMLMLCMWLIVGTSNSTDKFDRWNGLSIAIKTRDYIRLAYLTSYDKFEYFNTGVRTSIGMVSSVFKYH